MPYKEIVKETRCRGWCFTLQSWSEEDVAKAMSVYEFDDTCTYLIVGFERGDRTERCHLQCYCYFRNQVRESEMRKKLANVHVEAQKSKVNTQAYCYCMDEDDFAELGTRPRQGHRTDLEVIKHDLLKKKPITQISKEYFSQWCQYRRSFDEFNRIHSLDVYDTKFIMYDDDTIRDIYIQFRKDIPTSHIYIPSQLDHVDLWQNDVLHKYYSGKYSHIFFPNITGAEKFKDIVDETLY